MKTTLSALFGLIALVDVSAKTAVMPDPGNLTAYKDKPVSSSFEFEVIGSATGAIWGTDNYTLDSKLSVAAVHAGALKVGEKSTLVVTLTDGLQSYTGTSRNGVNTASWGAYAKSYQVKRKGGATVKFDVTPQNFKKLATEATVGTSWEVKVTGGDTSSVWGSKDYTLDSNLNKAAVHAGLVKVGETAKIKVTITPGLSAYNGTEQNGIKTSNWGSYQKSYQLSKLGSAVIDDPNTMAGIAKDSPEGTVFKIKVTGTKSGPLWGTDVYTLDSRVAKAAVHAGVLKDGETGVVTVTIKSGQKSYTGENRNDINSSSWGVYKKSYSISK